MKDYIYIITTFLIRFILRLLPHGKVHTNRIVFMSYLGKNYSCNPKYVCEYFFKHISGYELVWAFQSPKDYHYLESKGIKVVTYNSFKFIYICLTSKYIITNTRDLTHIPFTQKQQLINTWHGGGAYKRVGSSKSSQTISEKYRQYIARKTPYIFLSSSKFFTHLTIKESFHHDGLILNTGMPRNDLLILNDYTIITEKIHRIYQIPLENKLLIYAPTYREDRLISDYEFDTHAIQIALSQRFGGKWTILFRMHYYIAEQLTANNNNYINVSKYPDMQELLCASDILITDYSSSIWDFSFTKRPCFLYATDLPNYDLQQGFYTDIHTWPFPLAQNNMELIENILSFDNTTYQKKVIQHHEIFGSYEHGQASKQVVEYIVNNEDFL